MADPTYGELVEMLRGVVAKNKEQERTINDLDGRNRGLSSANRLLRDEHNRLNGEYSRWLVANGGHLLLQERDKHKGQLEDIRDSKMTASEALAENAKTGPSRPSDLPPENGAST